MWYNLLSCGADFQQLSYFYGIFVVSLLVGTNASMAGFLLLLTHPLKLISHVTILVLKAVICFVDVLFMVSLL